MKIIVEELKNRKKQLELILRDARRQAGEKEEGVLRIVNKKGKTMYYKIEGGKNIYLRKDQQYMAHKLAQKTYAAKVVGAAERELELISDMLRNFNPDRIANIHSRMKADRKLLVTPFEVSDEEYLLRWISKEKSASDDNGFEIKGEIYTAKGEHVRSKSEKIIADEMYYRGIPYVYEPMIVFDTGERMFPDFKALNVKTRKEYFIEHMGMMDDPDYALKAVNKINQYASNGFWPGKNLLLTFEGGSFGLNSRNVSKMIDQFLI